jgi:2,3-bisphosphoglycerate-dependent phosphoglycerate mutase
MLLLMRHGESSANAAGAFGGWLDVPLTDAGRLEARRAGERLAAARLVPDVVHTSCLDRATETARLVLDAAGAGAVEVHATWRLNERHYGALQGMSRAEARAAYGAEQVARWRRSPDGTPPPAAADDLRFGAEAATIRSESLRDVHARLSAYWKDELQPLLATSQRVLVVSHGNTLRMLLCHATGLSLEEATQLEVPTGRLLRPGSRAVPSARRRRAARPFAGAPRP